MTLQHSAKTGARFFCGALVCLVLAACGFDAHRTADEAGELPLDVPAVAVDANARFSRPAPRVAEGVAQLAHLFHQEVAPDPGYPAVWLTPG